LPVRSRERRRRHESFSSSLRQRRRPGRRAFWRSRGARADRAAARAGGGGDSDRRRRRGRPARQKTGLSHRRRRSLGEAALANFMEIDLASILRTFKSECDEHLARMEESLIALESDPGDARSLEAIFRGAHTIKGNAAGLGYARVAEFSHAFEELLQR